MKKLLNYENTAQWAQAGKFKTRIKWKKNNVHAESGVDTVITIL